MSDELRGNDPSWNTRADIAIRLVLPEEYAEAGAATLAAYAHDYAVGPDYAAEIADVAARASQHQVWVAVDTSSGAILGTVTTPRPGHNLYELGQPDELDFRLLGVTPQARGHGVGTLLTRHTLELARQRGLRAVVMNSGPHMVGAHRLYRSLGFARARQREQLIVSDGQEIRLLTFRRELDDPARPQYADWLAWHQRVEQTRRDPFGFLAITGLHWLGPVPARFEGVAGAWSVVDDRVLVELAPDEWVQPSVERITGVHQFGALGERTELFFQSPSGRVELAKRGGGYVLRPRDPRTDRLREYPGTDVFVFDESWQVHGRFVPDASLSTVGSVAPAITHEYPSPGVVEWEREGVPESLRVFQAQAGAPMFALFRDATAGDWTPAAVRSVPVRVDGTSASIDFNRTTNLPCAYTDFATCPLPPSSNILSAAVTAGEQAPQPAFVLEDA